MSDQHQELDPEAVVAMKYQAKALMRKRFRQMRGSIPQSGIAGRSAKIVERLLGLSALSNARTIALFDPILSRNEVDLRALDSALRMRSIHGIAPQIYYPQIDPTSREMVFRHVSDLALLEERGMGFREPPADAPIATLLDVIVVPVIAVDGRGHRIGYGAGFYDRVLRAFCPPGQAIAVAFDFQLAAEVPDTEGDVRVDTIVTDSKVIDPVG